MPKFNGTKWDRHAILAAIKRKGYTLERLAIENGLHKNTCKSALCHPYPKADRIISKFLSEPLHELWPDRYYVNGDRILPQNNHSRNMNAFESKKGIAA